MPARQNSPLCRLLKISVVLYRNLLSPLMLPACRFTPSCSVYAIESLDRHGAVQGMRLIAARLLKCHPFSKQFGADPAR